MSNVVQTKILGTPLVYPHVITIEYRAAIIDNFNGHQVQPFSYIIFGTICGTFGSLVDSILVRPTCFCESFHFTTIYSPLMTQMAQQQLYEK